MKLIKTFFLIIVMLFITYFLTLNTSEVYVDLVFYQFPNAPVSMIIFGSLSIGVFSGYLTAIFSILSVKAEIRNLKNKNTDLDEELSNLRNVSIDEGLYENEEGVL